MSLAPRCSIAPSIPSGGSSFSLALTGWSNQGGPSGTAPAAGDLVIISGGVNSNALSSGVSQSAGTGTWTFQDTGTVNGGTGGLTTFVAWRIFDGTETAPTFSWGSSLHYGYAAIALAPDSGDTAAVDVWATLVRDTTGTSHTAAAATAGQSGEVSLIFASALAAANGANAITFAPASSWTDAGSGGYAGAAAAKAIGSDVSYRDGVSGTVTPGAQTAGSGAGGTSNVQASLYHVLVRESAPSGSRAVVLSVKAPPPPAPPPPGQIISAPTITLSNDAEEGTAGTAVTTGNSGGLTENAFDLATGTTFTTSSIHGTLGFDMSLTGSTGTAQVGWSSASFGTPAQFWGRDYFTVSSGDLPPPAAVRISQVSNTTPTVQWGIGIDSATGKIGIRNQVGGSYAALSASALAAGTHRSEWVASWDGTTWTVTAWFFYGSHRENPVPDETLGPVSFAGTAAVAPGRWGFGAFFGTNQTWDIQHDDVAVSTAGPLGPVAGAPVPPPTTTTLVGAYVTATPTPGTWFSGGTSAQNLASAVSAWESDTGRTLTVWRSYQAMPSTVTSDITVALNAGQKVIVSYKPTANISIGISNNAPLASATAQSSLNATVTSFCNSLQTAVSNAGLDPSYVVIPFWVEPYVDDSIGASGKSTFADLKLIFQQYYPIISPYGFQVAWCTSAGDGLITHSEWQSYPGDAFVDIVATDFYSGAYGTGSRISGYAPNDPGGVPPHGNTNVYNPAWYADNASPKKPFAVYEAGVRLSAPGTNGVPSSYPTPATFVHYLRDAFLHRATLGLANGDITWFNSGNDTNNTPITTADGATVSFGSSLDNGQIEIRNGLFQNLFDTLNATGVQSSAALTGLGTLAGAGPAFTPAGALAGAGTLGGAPFLPATAALSGQGALASAPAFMPASAMSGTGTLTSAVPVQFTAAALSGSGTLSSAAPIIGAGGALAGVGSLASAPAFTPAAALSGLGSLTASPSFGITPAAALSGSGILTAATVFQGSGALSGAGTLSAAPALLATAVLSGSGTLGGPGPVLTQPIPIVLRAAPRAPPPPPPPPPSRLVTVTVTAQIPATAAMSGTGTLGGNWTQGIQAPLTGQGSLAAGPYFDGPWPLTGTGSLAAAPAFTPAAALSGSGTVAGAPYFDGPWPLSGLGSLSAAPAFGAAALSGSGSLTGLWTFGAQGLLSGTGTVAAAPQSAAPSIRGVPHYANSGTGLSSGSAVTVTKDPAVQPGDLIFIFITWNGTITVPSISGFTAYPKTSSSFSIALFSRVADGTEGSTFTISFGNGLSWSAVCVAYQDTNGVLDPVPSNSGTITLASTTITVPGVTTTMPGDVLAWFGATRANGPGAPVANITVPAALTQEGTQSSSSAATAAIMSVLMADGIAGTAGATGSMNGASSLSDNVGGVLVAAQPLFVAYTGTLAGTGSLTAAPAFTPAGALSGTGTLAGIFTAPVPLSGTGTLAGIFTAPVPLDGEGTLGGAPVLTQAAPLDGEGTLGAAPAFAAAASLDGEGTLSAGPAAPATATLSGSGSLPAAPQLTATAALAGLGTLGSQEVQAGQGPLSGSGSLAGAPAFTPAGVLAGLGTLTPAPAFAPAAALSGLGSLGTAPAFTSPGTLAGLGSLSATSAFTPAVILAGLGTLSAAPAFTPAGVLSGLGSLVATPAGAGLAGTGTLTATLAFGLTPALDGEGTLTGLLTFGELALLAGQGTLTAFPFAVSAPVALPAVAITAANPLKAAIAAASPLRVTIRRVT